MALLLPRFAAVVIAADLPVARRILLKEFDALQPLRAFPEIEMRHHQSHRAAVLLLQWLPRPGVRQQGVLCGKILQRQIGGVAVMGMEHGKPRFVARPAGIKEIAGRQPRPLVVVARPRGHAMDVGSELCLRLRRELRKIPENRILNRAVDVEPPALAGNLRRKAEVEGGPVPGQMLPRRQALLLRAGSLSGEEAALSRPALLAAGQLADRRLVIFVDHVWAGLGY